MQSCETQSTTLRSASNSNNGSAGGNGAAGVGRRSSGSGSGGRNLNGGAGSGSGGAGGDRASQGGGPSIQDFLASSSDMLSTGERERENGSGC